VLLAHERTHLRAKHHWHVGVVRAAAAVNPLHARLPRTSTYLCERWADESAAAAVGDRQLAATALARAALATATAARATGTASRETGTASRATGTGLGYHRAGVAGRIAALQRTPAPPRTATYLALALLALASTAVAADVEATAEFLHMIAGLAGR
jgi:hypothetical protein